MFKDFVLNKQLDEVEVDVAEDKVRFADKYSFPASAATAFRREGTAQYYPLGVVVHFFKFTESGVDVKEYIRRFPNRADQVALKDRPVSFFLLLLLVLLLPDTLHEPGVLTMRVSVCLCAPAPPPQPPTTQDLLKYLRGQAATVPQLDENVPLVPFEPPAKRQRVGGACEHQSPLAFKQQQQQLVHSSSQRMSLPTVCMYTRKGICPRSVRYSRPASSAHVKPSCSL